MTALLVASVIWWIDVQVDRRQLTPDWHERLDQLLAQASALYSTKDHELDYSCPVQLRAHTITVYEPRSDGSAPVAPEGSTYSRTRLYVYPGPGWAMGFGNANWARAWVGYWCPTSSPTCANGTSSAGVLIDPWGRSSAAWAVAHELGHAARLGHPEVVRPEDCSLMAYDSMLHVSCPNNGRRLTQADCAAIQRRALERPEPGDGKVIWLIPPPPPVLVP